MLQCRIDACSEARSFRDAALVVRDYSFYLARDFVRRIPGPVTARLFGPAGADRPIQETIQGGAMLTDGIFPHEEFVIEVRCTTAAFNGKDTGLPQAENWEIALREMPNAEDLRRFQRFTGELRQAQGFSTVGEP